MLACAVSVPADAALLQASGFNGNFASLFPGAYQVLQSDRGLSYGSAMLAVAGNTSTTTLTLGGALSTPPVPIRAKATSSAAIGVASFDISFDAGATFAMVGVVPIAGTPVPLTGPAAGLSLTWAAGNSVLNDTWNATCAALADQSGNARHATQATAALQPVVGVGVNGKVELIFDGVDDYLLTPGFDPPAGSMLYIVFRHNVAAGFKYVTDSVGGNKRALFQDGAGGGQTAIYNGLTLNGGVLPLLTRGRVAGIWNGAASSIKVGSNAIVNGDTGANAGGTDRTIGLAGSLGAAANCGVHLLVWAPPGPFAIPDAALNNPAGYGPGSILV